MKREGGAVNLIPEYYRAAKIRLNHAIFGHPVSNVDSSKFIAYKWCKGCKAYF